MTFCHKCHKTDYLIWHSKWRRMWTHLKFWLGAIHQFWAKYQLPSACQYLINTWKGPKGLIIYLCNFSAIVRWFPERFTILREKCRYWMDKNLSKCSQCENWGIFLPLEFYVKYILVNDYFFRFFRASNLPFLIGQNPLKTIKIKTQWVQWNVP